MTTVGNQQARTPDGIIIAGVGCLGWREGPANRVVAFLLIRPDDGPANAQVGRVSSLPRRQMASFTVAPGEGRHLIEMKIEGSSLLSSAPTCEIWTCVVPLLHPQPRLHNNQRARRLRNARGTFGLPCT